MNDLDAILLENADTASLRAEIAALAHVIWHQHYVPIIGQAQVDYMLTHGYSDETLAEEQNNGTHFTLARRGDRSIGFASVSPPTAEQPSAAWLDKLYVLQDARNLGVGRRLVIRAAEQATTLWGADRLALRVNRENDLSISAYRALGFETLTTDIKDIGNGFVMDDYIMTAPLNLFLDPTQH